MIASVHGARKDEGPLSGTRRVMAIACVLAALALVVLDAAMVNVALPAIARSLGVTAAASVRVVGAYQLALLLALLPCAALGERIGYRRVYAAGVALFVGAAALCAYAPSLSFLVAARLVQGLGGAAVMALGVALLRFIVPERELATAVGWNTLVVALASALGPALGALTLSVARWPALFAVNVALGATVLFATSALPRVERREASTRSPIIPFDLLREHAFRVSVIASVCSFAGQGASMVSLPFLFEHGFGQDTLGTGLMMTPWPLSVAMAAPLAGRLSNRVSGASLAAFGGGLLALGLFATAVWPPRGTHLALVPFVALCGVGFAFFQVSNNRNMFTSAPRTRSAAAGGMQGTARLTGQSIGAAIMTLLFTTTSLDVAPRLGLGIAAALTAIAGGVSLLRRSATGVGPARASIIERVHAK